MCSDMHRRLLCICRPCLCLSDIGSSRGLLPNPSSLGLQTSCGLLHSLRCQIRHREQNHVTGALQPVAAFETIHPYTELHPNDSTRCHTVLQGINSDPRTRPIMMAANILAQVPKCTAPNRVAAQTCRQLPACFCPVRQVFRSSPRSNMQKQFLVQAALVGYACFVYQVHAWSKP